MDSVPQTMIELTQLKRNKLEHIKRQRKMKRISIKIPWFFTLKKIQKLKKKNYCTYDNYQANK